MVAELMASPHEPRRFHTVSSQELSPAQEDWKPSRNALEMSDETAWQAKVSRVRELRQKERTQRDIVYQVWGVTPGRSPEYAQARAEYRQIIDLLNVEQADEESEG